MRTQFLHRLACVSVLTIENASFVTKQTLRITTVVFLAFAMPTFAQSDSKRFGAWRMGVMADNEGLYTATTNDSNGLFGYYCYRTEATCLWLIANDIKCIDGNKYPVLVNAPSGAFTTSVVCGGQKSGLYRYFIDYRMVESAIEEGTTIGMAFPTKDGKFLVSRFRLEGASEAVKAVERLARRFANDAPGTKDERL